MTSEQLTQLYALRDEVLSGSYALYRAARRFETCEMKRAEKDAREAADDLSRTAESLSALTGDIVHHDYESANAMSASILAGMLGVAARIDAAEGTSK